jgi:cell division protein FtsW
MSHQETLALDRPRRSASSQAENPVIQQMRPPQRIHGGLLIITFIMVCFGLVMLFSASMTDSFSANEGNAMYYILKQGSITLIGLVLALILAVLVPVGIFDSPAITVISYVVTTGLLVYVKFFGSIVNGAKRWILIGPLSIQPSEFAKLAAVIVLAGYFSRLRRKRQHRQIRYKSAFGQFIGDGWRDILVPGFMMLVWLGLIIWQPHVSGFAILSIVIFASFLAAGLPFRSWLSGVLQLLVILVLIGALALGAFAIALQGQDMQAVIEDNFSHAFKRIETFRNPEEASSDDSYQIRQSLIAIGSGGLTGVGLGEGRQKYNYLPEAHNDYVFAIIGEELGFAGTVSVVLLFLVFMIFGIRIAWQAINPHAAILSAGYTVLITTQALLNIGVATRSLPATGISLPFFSYGGTSNLFFMLAIGFILAVSRTGQLPSLHQRRLMGEIEALARGDKQ